MALNRVDALPAEVADHCKQGLPNMSGDSDGAVANDSHRFPVICSWDAMAMALKRGEDHLGILQEACIPPLNIWYSIQLYGRLLLLLLRPLPQRDRIHIANQLLNLGGLSGLFPKLCLHRIVTLRLTPTYA